MDSCCEDLWRECAPGGSCPPSSIPDHHTVFSFVTTLMGCCFVNLNKDSPAALATTRKHPCFLPSSLLMGENDGEEDLTKRTFLLQEETWGRGKRT
ncbi:hypothetical protein C4D60_Mb04t27570 [Musa balbisiana]|uniref:Uncharacterized protein n=1 Tax=Musa balbisiana TaxID=52838 RepID=A0A4S8KF69_MUSBA|nr:hypothetical protein C4D60_Mb04t27570 [Musa balbisiana]